MAELTISVNTHHFVVRRVSPSARSSVEAFVRKYIQYGIARSGNRYARTALKVYAASTKNRSEYRLHITQLPLFMEHLDRERIRTNEIEIIQEPVPEAVKVDLPMFPKWVPRSHQPPIIEYLVEKPEKRSKLVSLRTGKGKTFVALNAISKLGLRSLFIMKPKYVEKWIDDVRKTYDIAMEDLLVVRGSDQLLALIMMAKAGLLTSKIILISNRTLQNWISLYELHGKNILEMGYECLPHELCAVLGVGIRLIDEVHEDYHLNFKIDLYTNVDRSISLSATLTSYDPFQESMYEIAYPRADRYEGPKFENYVISRAIFYKFKNPNKIRFQDPATKSYSHHVLEQSILRDSDTAANYFDMINRVFKELYIKKVRPGKTNRALIFASSIDMCTALTSYLQKKYPTLDVRRYVEDDPYSNLMEADVSVSTLQSAGTGVDIADLIAVILTTNVLSKQGNIQGQGRLRELIDGTQPEFGYLVCVDISKHVEYHRKKSELLQKESAVFRTDTMQERV